MFTTRRSSDLDYPFLQGSAVRSTLAILIGAVVSHLVGGFGAGFLVGVEKLNKARDQDCRQAAIPTGGEVDAVRLPEARELPVAHRAHAAHALARVPVDTAQLAADTL